ncbi:MAG: riboflavin synthase [Nitrospiraceae bacterium]|nr:riboflavin synthase [Nitrospiraceae bacterium]
MFTGLIRELGAVAHLRRVASGARLAVAAPLVSKGSALGASVAVNGVCLTVTDARGDVLEFDISSETLRSTDLGGLKPGEKVNLEPALLAQDALGGHLVSGHVDGVGKIRSKTETGEAWKVEIEAPPSVLRYLVPKGSVAVDGISLTVVDVLPEAFTVVIIPHTARNTTIGFKTPPSPVNLEADIIGKYVAKFLGGPGGGKPSAGGAGLTMESLIDSGFINGQERQG